MEITVPVPRTHTCDHFNHQTPTERDARERREFFFSRDPRVCLTVCVCLCVWALFSAQDSSLSRTVCRQCGPSGRALASASAVVRLPTAVCAVWPLCARGVSVSLLPLTRLSSLSLWVSCPSVCISLSCMAICVALYSSWDYASRSRLMVI